nr:putative ribonuclease H-like domain-containing protein [Tanacetum cinerariifolium]
SDILKKFITEIENLKGYKVKIIRCDNWGEFRNKEMNDFCSQKGIKREFSNARTPQQNGVAKRRNRTLIEAARTMVFNKRTIRVEENLHVEFLKNKAIEQGAGPTWLFNIDSLTKSMNYMPVVVGTNSINLSGTKDAANQEVKKNESSLRYIVLPNWAHDALLESTSSKPYKESISLPADQMETLTVKSPISTISSPVPTACLNDSSEPYSKARLVSKRVANQEETPSLDNILSLTNRFDDILRVSTSSDEIIRVEADVSNMETSISASPTPTLKIYKDHPKSQIIGPVDTLIQTRHKSKIVEEQSFMATIHQKTDPA